MRFSITAVIGAFVAVVVSAASDCDFALDVVLVQDLTHSYKDDLPNLRIQVPNFVSQLEAEHPGSRVGIVTFKDHGVEPFGYAGYDYCARLNQALTDDHDIIKNAVDAFDAAGGLDWHESQLTAMQYALLSDDVGWRPKGTKTATGALVYRLIILITDAGYHIAKDGAGILRDNDKDADPACGYENYPTLPEVAEAFASRDALFGVLASNDSLVDFVNVKAVYEELIEKTVGEPRGLAMDMDTDAGNFLGAASDMIDKLSTIVCDCEESFSLEVAYVQDLTHSFTKELDMIKATVPTSFTATKAEYPHSKFALASFTDKPVEPFGWAVSMDYCYWLHQGLKDDVSEFTGQLAGSFIRSGADWKEAVMDALFQIGTDPNVGWTPTEKDGDGRTIKRVIIAVTDGAPHLAGDGLAEGLTVHDGLPGLDCKGEDYPSSNQVSSALKNIGPGETAVAFGVESSLVPTYAAIAAQWTAAGVPTFTYALGDLAGDLQAMIKEMTDPCRPSRRLEGHGESIIRQLSMPVPEPRIAMQAPIPLTPRQLKVAHYERKKNLR